MSRSVHAGYAVAHLVGFALLDILLYGNELVEEVIQTFQRIAEHHELTVSVLDGSDLAAEALAAEVAVEANDDITHGGTLLGGHVGGEGELQAIHGRDVAHKAVGYEVLQPRVEAYLWLYEAHRVDGGEHDAVGAVGCHNLLRDGEGEDAAEGIYARVLYALDLIVEEAVEVAVVLVNVEGLLRQKNSSTSPS